MFGEKIYLTGVDTKNGISVQKELTVGQPKSLNSLAIQGFVKKGTTKLVKELPSGFKAGEYYMVFEAADQNGNQYPTNKIKQDDITFVSDNPLLISKLDHDATAPAVKTLVVDGVEMAAMIVQPGMNADKGGEVNLKAIANKTGKETVKNVVVGNLAILTTFDMLEPTGIVAEGESVTIPFAAYDQNGKAITNFTTLAREAGINKLTLNAPQTGSLKLEENNDGTASLVYSPGAINWNDSKTTDGVDRPVSLTTVVVGGNASNLMLSVADKARPVGIKSVDFDKVLVEQGTETIQLTNDKDTTSFKFVDQYGREMLASNAHEFFNTGTFAAGQDFVGYSYYIRATYKGDAGLYGNVGSTVVKNDAEFNIKATDGSNSLTLTAKDKVTGTAKTGMALQFEIVKYKNSTEGELGVSPVKTESLSIVDITSVKNFEVKELPRLEVKTNNSNLPTGNGLTLSDPMIAGTDGSLETPAQKEVKVTGDYNGKAVTVPGAYLDLESNQVVIDGSNKITKVKDHVAAKVAEAGIAQVETATVALGTAATGDITVVVTANEMANSPKTITVPVLAADTDANAIATKVGTALSADTDVKAFFNVGGTGAEVVLTAKTAAANDTTMNISLTDAGTILTDAPTSQNTTAGKAPKLATPKIGFVWGDFYDATTANFLRKDAKATITAKVKDLDKDSAIINTANRTVLLSDAAPVATTIKGPETLSVKPDITKLAVSDIKAAANLIVTGAYKVLDQYGEDFTADINYKAVNVEENKDGYVLNNFKITKNDTKDLDIKGAERGDTFTLELRAGNAKLTVKTTVGADKEANITNGDNNYLKNLIGNGTDNALEHQRLDSLK